MIQDTILLALAALALLRVWFFSSLLTNCRSYYEAKSGWLSDLLSCPLCLSYHLCFALGLIFLPCTRQSLLQCLAAAAVTQSIWLLQHDEQPLSKILLDHEEKDHDRNTF